MLINKIDTASLNKYFSSAKPYPYVVIDNFFRSDFFDDLSNEMDDYYRDKGHGGVRFNTEVENNKWGSTGLILPKNLQKVNNFLSSKEFIDILSEISGFTDLRVTADINGVGYSFFHAMPPGSYLGPHTDHTRDMGSNNGAYHVLNIIIYMQSSWNANWLGGTNLYIDGSHIASTVEYMPNRALIFLHSPYSIHGTQVVSKLAGANRLSLYYDYYCSNGDPYSHLSIKKFPLIKSGHLFYLSNYFDYFKIKNRKYLIGFLGHYKNLFLNYFKK